MTSLGAFLLMQILGTALCAENWAYEEGIDGVLGPKEWENGYNFCGHPGQSPVNIVKNEAEQLSDYEDNLYWSIDTHFSNVNLTNNGLYLVLKSKDMSSINIRRTFDEYVYKLVEIRFHWGQNDSVGSEYTFDGKSYPLEMQLIFYSIGLFDSYEECLLYGFGLYIVAVEFEIASKDNEDISDVVNALESIQEVGKTEIIEKLDSSLEQLLPANRTSFYLFYEGSMTSPPCASAQWMIYMDPKTVSSNQMKKFRQLDSKYGGKLINTDRPIQPLGDNLVYYNTYQ